MVGCGCRSLLQSVWSTPPAASRRRNFAFEIVSDAQGVTLCANVPGLEASAISVAAEGATLTISGTRSTEHREGGNYRLRERVFGAFSQTFHLSEDLDTGAIEASCRDGVLTVRVAKRTVSPQRTIEIKVS
jgi:HSP20 family protein